MEVYTSFSRHYVIDVLYASDFLKKDLATSLFIHKHLYISK